MILIGESKSNMPESKNNKDARSSIRKPLRDAKIKVFGVLRHEQKLDGVSNIQTQGVDISQNGIKFEINLPLKKGDWLELGIQFADMEKGLKASGIVTHATCKRLPNGSVICRAGISFKDMSERLEKALEEHIVTRHFIT